MWNGLFKLTVMVGVIGVGLYAAYQAQLGMDRSVAVAENDSSSEESDASSTESSADRGKSSETSVEDPSELFAKSDPNPTTRKSQQRKKSDKGSDSQIELLDNFADDEPKVKTAVASNRSPVKVIVTKRTQRKPVDVREGASDTDDDSAKSDDAPKRLPDEESDDASVKKTRQLVRQVRALSSEDESTTPDADANPFDSEPPAAEPIAKEADTTPPTVAADSQDTKTQNADSREEPNLTREEPGRARISNDFSSDSDVPRSTDVPRSKRAKKNANKRAEPPAETESNPFGDEPKANAGQSLAAPEMPPAENTPVVAAPETSGTSLPSELPSDPDQNDERDTNRRSNPPSLPPEHAVYPNDDPIVPRSSPKRTRPTQLPADPNADLLGGPPPRAREPLMRQSEYDRVTPVDMVGDGVAGDPSQRGLQQPRLTIEKVAQQQAVLEQPLIYTIIVKNTGSVDAHNIVIEDRIPKGTELQGTSPQAELSGKRLIWNHLVLKPNEEKKISIKVIPKQEGPIGSVARVYFATEVTAEIVVTAPQLEFTVKAPNRVRVGQKFDMVFSLKNIGSVDSNNIIVRDLVPEFLKHEAGTDIECPIGKMAPQDVREIVLPVIAIKTGSVVNRAVLTADSGVKKTLDSQIDIVGEVLVLTRTGQNRLYVERSAVFTNNIRNDGNLPADRVKIAEVVPAGMEFETASDGGKYDPNLKAVVWTVGPLAPGNDKSVTVKYVPRETGTLPAKITATGNAGSTATVNGTVDVIGKPELQMETLTATGAVTVGERVTSRFQLNNTGTASANNVQLRVRLPRELKLISVNRGVNFQQKDDYVLFEPIGELAPRTKMAYELVLEPIAEADAQIGLEISADHLTKPGRRVETIQIARDALK